LRTSKVKRYSSHGNAMEEEDILGIHSCAKFGYNGTLPYLVAGNAPYASVSFESFENTYVQGGITYLENDLRLESAYGSEHTMRAHTGAQSFQLATGPQT